MPKLNPRQQQAVRHIDGPLLVLAGAGSGKTRVITHKIGWLIGECGLAPRTVAAVTFTNKAVREMKARVAVLLGGKSPPGLTVSTFHTLGLNILRREHAALGYRSGFSILGGSDCAALTRELLRTELSARSDPAEAVHAWISRWKNARIAPAQAAAHAGGDPLQQAAARVYGAYQRQLKAYNAFDLDDLIVQPVELFAARADVLAAWRERLLYLLVDEYQDTNATQYALVRQLAARGALTVVGDDDQSIYAWRGARPENLAQLREDFPGLGVIKLEQNYRSSGRILKAANRLIAQNPHVFEKALWSELGYGEPIRVLKARDQEHEAERAVAALLHHRFNHRGDWRDYAILYRGNHQSRPFERALREQRIPYYVSGGSSFFERSEIKDVMAYLRLLANPDDDSAFLHIVNTPRRGLGATTLERLSEFAGERGLSLLAGAFEVELSHRVGPRPLAVLRDFSRWVMATVDAAANEPLAAAQQMLRDIQYEDWLKETSADPATAERRLENVRELLDWLKRLARAEQEKTLAALVADITLMGILDREQEDEAQGVALMTLHAAKGLEFPHVCIVGLEENLLPHRTALAEGALEEERRLFYVGLTRARQTLTLTLAAARRRHGEVVDCVPSRFLEELPADDLQWDGRDTGLDPEEKRARGEAYLAGLRRRLAEGS